MVAPDKPAPQVRRTRVKRARPPASKATQTRSALKIQSAFHKWIAIRRARILARIVFDKVYDVSTGAYFFFNTHTAESQWVPPFVIGTENFDTVPAYADYDAVADILAARVRNWEKQEGSKGGNITIYVNPDTGETLTKEPKAMIDARDAMKISAAELDIHWTVEFDQSSGLRVFVNKKTGKRISKKPKRKGFKPPKKNVLNDEEKDEKVEEEKEGVSENAVDVEVVQDDDLFPSRPKTAPNQPSSVLTLLENTSDEIRLCHATKKDRLHLDHCHLRELPSAVMHCKEHLKHLSLRANRIQKIPEDIKFLENLETLDFSGNRVLGSIPVHFWYFTKLKVLDLRQNRVVELPREVGNMTILRDINLWELGIENMASLTHLRLDHNEIEKLPEEISKVTTLKVLTVSSNILEKLPENFTLLKNLEVLALGNNSLCSLPADFGSFNKLTDLNINYNKLSSLPLTIGNLSNLEHLQADHNEITALPHDMKRLKILRSLDLGHNLLENIPEDCFDATSALVNLDLSYNKLQSFDFCATKLLNLDISHNQIKTLDDSLLRFLGERLVSMDASHNGLTTFSAQFAELRACTNLNVSHNHISELPDVMGHLEALTHFNMSHNRIEVLPTKVGGPALVSLNLSHNMITELGSSLEGFVLLQDINLEWNKLTKLPSYFPELENLQVLRLERNQISDLPASMSKLKYLQAISISFNKLKERPLWLASAPKLQSFNMGFNDVPNDPKSIDKKVVDFESQGDINVYNNELIEAVDNFSRALELIPEEDERCYACHLKRAGALTLLKKLDEAMYDATAAIVASDERNPEALMIRGRLLRKLGAAPAALDDVSRALEIAPEYQVARKERSRAYLDVGMYQEALNDADLSLKFDPFDPESHCLRGLALTKLCNLPDAMDSLSKATELAPLLIDPYHHRALILRDSGHFKEASEEFLKAVAAAAGENDIETRNLELICLSSCLQLIGQAERASLAYRCALAGELPDAKMIPMPELELENERSVELKASYENESEDFMTAREVKKLAAIEKARQEVLADWSAREAKSVQEAAAHAAQRLADVDVDVDIDFDVDVDGGDLDVASGNVNDNGTGVDVVVGVVGVDHVHGVKDTDTNGTDVIGANVDGTTVNVTNVTYVAGKVESESISEEKFDRLVEEDEEEEDESEVDDASSVDTVNK